MWLLESFTHINDALELGMSATVLTRDAEAFAAKAPHLTSRKDLWFIRGDIQNFDFPEGTFEYIVHAATAASAKLNKENPLLMYDTITLGTRRLLQFAEQCGVEKLLLTSSGAVYGKQPVDISHVPEVYFGGPDPLDLNSAYAEGKRAAEHVCALHARKHNYECKIARCFAFVGPHLPMDAHFAIGNFLRDVIQGKTIKISGDGTPYRSYMYAADLAMWLWVILLIGKPGIAYNVGSEEVFTIRELAECVKNATLVTTPVYLQGNPDIGKRPERYVPSTARSREQLCLPCPFGLSDALSKTYLWLKDLA
jgi:dTDP-glucose 4,6-dehydratase